MCRLAPAGAHFAHPCFPRNLQGQKSHQVAITHVISYLILVGLKGDCSVCAFTGTWNRSSPRPHFEKSFSRRRACSGPAIPFESGPSGSCPACSSYFFGNDRICISRNNRSLINSSDRSLKRSDVPSESLGAERQRFLRPEPCEQCRQREVVDGAGASLARLQPASVRLHPVRRSEMPLCRNRAAPYDVGRHFI